MLDTLNMILFTGIGRANLAFVVDGSNAELIMFIQRYVYNYIRLFQLQGTYVTIMAYGRDQYRVASWVSFVSPQEIQVNEKVVYFCSPCVVAVHNLQTIFKGLYSIIS